MPDIGPYGALVGKTVTEVRCGWDDGSGASSHVAIVCTDGTTVTIDAVWAQDDAYLEAAAPA